MDKLYIGFWLTNLIIPGDPDTISFVTPAGTWDLRKHPQFDDFRTAVVDGGKCAETYSVEGETAYAGGRSAALDALFQELIPICLGSSYLTGLSVAPSRGLPHSEVQLLDVGDHFPRPRAMGSGFLASASASDFIASLKLFVTNYPTSGQAENSRLLCHHWLDALAFWSLEDLVLSTGTVLEVIAATAAASAPAGADVGTFNKNLAYAASRFGLPALPPRFRRMRNDLVHEGTLSGSKFPSEDRDACGLAAAEALDWIDQYIFKALALGPSPAPRFAPHAFRNANSFSLP